MLALSEMANTTTTPTTPPPPPPLRALTRGSGPRLTDDEDGEAVEDLPQERRQVQQDQELGTGGQEVSRVSFRASSALALGLGTG